MTPQERDALTVERILKHTVSRDGHLFWDGHVTSRDGRPLMTLPDTQSQTRINPRRWLYEFAERNLLRREWPEPDCGEPNCIQVAHMKVVDRSELYTQRGRS